MEAENILQAMLGAFIDMLPMLGAFIEIIFPWG